MVRRHAPDVAAHHPAARGRPHRRDRDAGPAQERRRAPHHARLRRLAARRALGHGPRRLSHRAAQPGHRRRPAGAGDRRRDHGGGAGARPRASPAGTPAARSRRAARRGTGGGPRLHGVAAAVRRTRRHRRTVHPDRAGHHHRRRRHARRLCLPRQPSPLDAADGVSGRLRAADRAADHRGRAAGAGLHPGTGLRRSHHPDRSRAVALAGDAPAPAAAGAGLRRAVARRRRAAGVRQPRTCPSCW